jgi:hypothetical protein
VKRIKFKTVADLKMRDILEGDLNQHGNKITEVVDVASNEIRMEFQLKKLGQKWSFHIKV